MNNAPKTVLCIHDLSCLGRASLAVVFPVLSAMGIQPVALPTAVLSTHTGGLGTPIRMIDPNYDAASVNQYHRLGMTFDAIYSGYLTSANQARLVEQIFAIWPHALHIVDPVMGDNGTLYSGITPDMVAAHRSLCAHADLILPNQTEAALLAGDAPMPTTEDASMALAQALTKLCPQVVITGVAAARTIGCAGAERGNQPWMVRQPRIPRSYPGTGDIFASAMVGHLLRGNVPEAAAGMSARFVRQCVEGTPEDADTRLGVWLEPSLPLLLQETAD